MGLLLLDIACDSNSPEKAENKENYSLVSMLFREKNKVKMGYIR